MTDVLAGIERAVDLADAVRARDVGAVEAVKATLARIEARNPAINAFVHVDAEAAIRTAADMDRRIRRGEDPGPLAGVPIGVKDAEDCAGMPTACGSLVHKDAPPARRDSISVGRLRGAGAIPVGKTAIPEFCSDAATFSRAFGVTRNPWDLERTPGGSSGGSAAAVASGMVMLATGSDSGGSIRGPAAFCGVVGMKPSYGRVPVSPVEVTNTVGALVGCAEDAARHLDVVKGPDDRDWLSLPADPTSYEQTLVDADLSGSRAIWSELGYPRIDQETYGLAESAAHAVAAFVGLTLETAGGMGTDRAEAEVYSTWRPLELWMAVDEALWAERRPDLTEQSIRYLENGLQRTVPGLARAQVLRSQVADAVATLFTTCDFLLTPSSSIPAFSATESLGRITFQGEPVPFGPDPQLLLANICGSPAISVPAGVTRDGLPVGLQIIGRRHRDHEVLALAHAVARARPWPRWHAGPPGWQAGTSASDASSA